MADFTSLEAVTGINRSIAEQMGGDHCFAVNQPMRLPGTINHPTAAKRKRGRVPALATIEQPDNGRVYAPAALTRYFPPVAPAADRAEVDIGEVEPLDFAALGLSKLHPLYATLMLPSGDDGSKDALLAAGDMHRAGFNEQRIAGILLNEDIPAAAHVHRQANPHRAVLRILQRVIGDAENGAGGAGEGGAGSRAADRGARAPGTSSGAEAQPLDLIDAGWLAGKPAEQRTWTIEPAVPPRQVTLYTAQGGGGKSYTALTMAAAVSLGALAFGMQTQQGAAIYLTCEDDDEENHRRLIGVANSLNAGLDRFAGKLFMKSLVERRDKGLARIDQNSNKLHIAALFYELRATILATKPTLVILDNVAHLFEGNENIRAHVAAFIGLLNSLALETDCAIILIGHPNKAGDSFSGSTAFQNQVRSHLHLEVDDDDPDLRTLTLAKANYGRLRDPIKLRWNRGAFRLDSEVAEDDPSRFDALKHRQDELFLACLDAATDRNVNASASKNAGNYAPKLFATMREARDLRAKELEESMARLFARKRIEVGELPFRSPDRKRIDGVRRASGWEVDDAPM